MQLEPEAVATPAQTHELLAHRLRDLDIFTSPASIALVGASESPASVGRTLLTNLLASRFGGTVFPVNPKRQAVLGITAYSSLRDVPSPIDLAVIATPASTVPGIIRECVEHDVKGAIIISAGFAETGEEGRGLEAEIREARLGSTLRIIGPNCLGVMAPHHGLNATFAASVALPGKVGFLSQSGALLTAILDWSLQERIGFSAFVSLGSMLDVSWGDWIDYLGDDPYTDSILIYMESIGNPRAFLSAARAVSLRKPIIVLKAGRTSAAAKAAASHTGALAGSDEVLDAAFRRVGVLRVDCIADLFSMAEVLAKQPRPTGPRLTIMTNAGGPGVLATDALLKLGGRLAELSPGTVNDLDRVLPKHWSRANPVDILGDASPDHYADAFHVLDQEPETDGHLIILTPQAMTDPTMSAERLKGLAQACQKPVLSSWMGGSAVAAGRAVLAGGDIATFDYPEAAVQAFVYMWRYSDNLRALYETPTIVSEVTGPARQKVERLIEKARCEGRTLLNEVEAKQIVAAYDIPAVETWTATTRSEAVSIADKIGYPVVLKLYSPTITHKTDVGGVRLNLGSPAEVGYAFTEIEASVAAKIGREQFAGVTVQKMVISHGYELILGSSTDAQFGPVILFGAGGITVEVFRDRALGLPPLNTTLARRMMEQTRIIEALKGARGKPVNLSSLEELLVRFSQLVIDHPTIREFDINPLLVDSEACIALDARVVLHDQRLAADRLPRPVIRPYPAQYTTSFALPDGQIATIRAIRPEDEPLLVRFHQTLSVETVHHRYAQVLPLNERIAHQRLSRICFADYDRDMVLVVEIGKGPTERQLIAVGRLSRLSGSDYELALLVGDAFQRQGIGRRLMRQLVHIAKLEGMTRIIAYIAIDNVAMRRICERAQFTFHVEVGQCVGTLNLRG